MMTITGFRVLRSRIPFNISFNHTTRSRSEVEAVLLEVHTDDGSVGFGEALPREYVTGESNESVIRHAVTTVLPSLIGRRFHSFADVLQWLGRFHEHYPDIATREQCIKTLVELGLLDAFGKVSGASVADLLGGQLRSRLRYSGVVSSGSPELVDQYLQAYAQLGMRQLKLKVGGDWEQDLRNIRATRDVFGQQIDIRVDANEAWDLDTAIVRLKQLSALGVRWCEQPMPAALRDAYPKLRRSVSPETTLCIDESLCAMTDAHWFIDHRGADAFNLRVSKNGGIAGALALARLAAEAGIQCQLGSQVGETSLLTRAGQIVASCCPTPLTYHEGAFGTMLLAYDLTVDPIMFGREGLLDANRPAPPGLGVDIHEPQLRKSCETVWQSARTAVA